MNIIQITAIVFLIACLLSCARKPAEQPKSPEETPPAYLGISKESDMIDLDTMPVGIRYANAYSLVIAPEAYAGKSLKVTAPVTEITVGEKKKKMLALAIYDAARCCLVIIPFELDKTTSRRKEPFIGKTMTIIGTITPIKGQTGLYLAGSQIQP